MKLTQQNLSHWLEEDILSPTLLRWKKDVAFFEEDERIAYEREFAGNPAGYLRSKAGGKQDYFLYVQKSPWSVKTILKFLKNDEGIGSGCLRRDLQIMLIDWNILKESRPDIADEIEYFSKEVKKILEI